MSLVINKLNVQNNRQQIMFADGPDRKVHVLNLETLKKQTEIIDLDGE